MIHKLMWNLDPNKAEQWEHAHFDATTDRHNLCTAMMSTEEQHKVTEMLRNAEASGPVIFNEFA